MTFTWAARPPFLSHEYIPRSEYKEDLAMNHSTFPPAPTAPTTRRVDLRAASIVGLAALAWLAAYNVIQPLANWITYALAGLPAGSRLGESIAFFLYDVPKILLLLGGMIFAITMIRSFFSPEQTRALLGGKREGVGNVLAASLGVVTPFCSCSA